MAAGLNDTTQNIGTDAIAAACPYLAIHTATPDASGSNQSTAARVAASWPAAATGDVAIANKSFTGGAPGGAATHVGLWSAPTGGVFRGYYVLAGDQTFNTAGEFTLVSLTLTGSAS